MGRARPGWKALYYGPVARLLRKLPPAHADAVVAALGRAAAARPSARAEIGRGVERARLCLRPPLPDRFGRLLAEHRARLAIRDVLLDGLDEDRLEARFDISGHPLVATADAAHRPCIFVGCHLGAYIPALHWLCQRMPTLRLIVQRPTHVSRFLHERFDDPAGPFPQPGLSLRRGLPAAEAAKRVLCARSALLSGLPLYLCGDIPWPKGRAGQWLGATRVMQALWVDLAAITGAPVVPVFAFHEQGGRYSVELDEPFVVPPGGEDRAVQRYVETLEKVVLRRPEQAVPYWTWPAYESPNAQPKGAVMNTGCRDSGPVSASAWSTAQRSRPKGEGASKLATTPTSRGPDSFTTPQPNVKFQELGPIAAD